MLLHRQLCLTVTPQPNLRMHQLANVALRHLISKFEPDIKVSLSDCQLLLEKLKLSCPERNAFSALFQAERQRQAAHSDCVPPPSDSLLFALLKHRPDVHLCCLCAHNDIWWESVNIFCAVFWLQQTSREQRTNNARSFFLTLHSS